MPGLTLPDPRTWTAGDDITVPRLRGDMTNLASLFTAGRPLVMTGNFANPIVTSGSDYLIAITYVYVNTWDASVLNSGSTNQFYNPPVAGWYLATGSTILNGPGTTPTQWHYSTGFYATTNGTGPASVDGGSVSAGSGSGAFVGASGADLYQFNPETSDGIAQYVFDNISPGSTTLLGNYFAVEWVALPTSGLTDYTGPYGVVVASPVAAAAFPSGQGTTITNSGGIAAGATSVTVADATGMVTGGTLGLDYIAGQQYQPAAEAVTISSVTGTTIGISATSFAHAQGAPVAVPVSAAFLNQQDRDIIRFLAYPPICRLVQQSAQSIPSQTYPAGTTVTGFSATVDNFSGSSSSGYTAPVSGVYFIAGQVYYDGTTSSCLFSAGLSVAGGTTQWGTVFAAHTSAETSFCATVTRHLRLTAGQAVTLIASQNSGSSMDTARTGTAVCKLIAVWRSF